MSNEYYVFSRSLNITNPLNQSEETKNTPSPATKVRDVSKHTYCTSSNQLSFYCGHTVKLTLTVFFSLLSDRLMRSLVAVQEVQVWMVTRMVPHQLFHNPHEWVTIHNIIIIRNALVFFLNWVFLMDLKWLLALDLVDVLTVVCGMFRYLLPWKKSSGWLKNRNRLPN